MSHCSRDAVLNVDSGKVHAALCTAAIVAVVLMPVLASAAPGDILWTYSLPGRIYSSPVVDTDGTVYISDRDLHAVSADGEPLWVYSTDHSLGCTPALADSTLYSACTNLVAIDTSGVLRWTHGVSEWAHNPPGIGTDGTVHFGARNVYAVNRDGLPRWTYASPRRINTPVTLAVDGTSYTSSDGKILAISVAGDLIWSFAGGALSESSPIIDGQGHIIASVDNVLYRLDQYGTMDWSFTAPGTLDSSPAIGPDGTVYVGCNDGNLYALGPGGNVIWKFATQGPVKSSPAVASDGTIYVGSVDGNIYAVGSDGVERWRVPTGDDVVSSPAIAADGTVYVGSLDKTLYAIEGVPGGLAASAWPTYRGNAGRTGLSSAVAQRAFGAISGTVTDATTGLDLVAWVILQSATSVNHVQSQVETGKYAFAALTPGSYNLTALRFGYMPFSGVLDVEAGKETNYNPILVPR